MIPDSQTELVTNPLFSAGNEEEFRLHLAALEWSLADPIVIERAEDVKSTVRWQERLEPYSHQMQNLMTYCRRLPVTLIADDVGLGKTISAGLILSELIARRRVSRTLVICPSILGPQWIDELETKFGIFGRWGAGKSVDSLINGEADLVATTYQSISPRLKNIRPGMFDMLILDEAHKLRNLHGTKKPPKMAENIHRALDQRLFKYVLMLTATPIQNRLWDLYSLVDYLAVAKGHKNPFGSPVEFRNRFIGDASATARVLRPGMGVEFQRILRQYLVRTRRQDVKLMFPQRKVQLVRAAPNSTDQQIYGIVARQIRNASGLVQSSLAQALMSSPQALLAQLRNMAKKNPQWATVASDVEIAVSNMGEYPSKVQRLLRVIDEIREHRKDEWRLVVFTIRRETQQVIGKALASRGIEFGLIQGGAAAKNLATVQNFTASPPRINVILSTDAGAEGVNLQAGNVLVNFDLPWNPMIVEQRIGRIQRLASNHRHVLVVNLVVANSPEEKVVGRLMEKLQTIVDTVGDIEAILEASGGDSDAEESTIEKQIHSLVMESLAGQDVEQATALAQESIQEAKSLFEQHQEEMDVTLGQLDEGHDTGPSMPRLTPVKPTVDHEEFVSRALVEDGYQFNVDDLGMLHAQKYGSPPMRITFDENEFRQQSRPGAFMGKAPVLYLPGKPAFERLVQHWLDRSGHFVLDRRNKTRESAQDLFRDWARRIDGAELVGIDVLKKHDVFQGRIRCKITSSNALDSYEKFVEVTQLPKGHKNIQSDGVDSGEVIQEDLNPVDILPELRQYMQKVVQTDKDLVAFGGFYSERLDEELTKTGTDPVLRRKVQNDLRPTVHGTAVAMRGIQYEICRFKTDFKVDGHEGYSLEINACPATGQIFSEPELWGKCAESGKVVPVTWLGECALSEATVLLHMLVRSDESGRMALEEHTVKCPISGRVALADEFFDSDISGTRAVASEFLISPISGRRGLRSEFATCEFTGSQVVADELAISELSDRKFRIDEGSKSAMSGTLVHKSELVECALTGEQLLPAETGMCSATGATVRVDRLVKSEKSPHKLALPDKLITCEVSGKRLLPCEVAECSVTGKTVDRDLLAPSEESGSKALPDELIECQLTGKRVLPTECVKSVVSGVTLLRSMAYQSPATGAFCSPNETEPCEITGTRVLPSDLVQSDVSSKKFRRDEAVTSDLSGRRGHKSEALVCAFTSKTLLQDEAATSEVSGKTMAVRDAVISDNSGRKAHPTEVIRCGVSDRLLLKDEVAESSVSGMIVDSELLVASSKTGSRALEYEMVNCEKSGALLLSTESGRCGVSGKTVDSTLLERSAVSGKLALPEYMTKCAATSKLAFPNELVRCEITNQLLIPNVLEACVVTGKRGRRDKMVTSVLSNRFMVPSAAIRSIIDRRTMCPDEAVFCYWNEGFLLPEQAGTCVRTRLTFSKQLIDTEECFVYLAQLMRGELEVGDFSDMIPWLHTQYDGKLKSVKRAWGVQSQRGSPSVVLVEMSELLGMRIRHAGLVVQKTPQHKILGRVTCKTDKSPGWVEL